MTPFWPLRRTQPRSSARLRGGGIHPQSSNDVLKVEEGALYPALHRLVLRGWLSSEWGLSENNRRAKFYTLTAAGGRQLSAEADAWTRLAAAVTHVLNTT